MAYEMSRMFVCCCFSILIEVAWPGSGFEVIQHGYVRVCKLPTVAPAHLPASSDGSEILAAGCLQCQRCDRCSGVSLVEYAAHVRVCVCVNHL